MKTISRVILSAIILVLTGLLVAAANYLPDLVFAVYPAFSGKVLSTIAAVTAPIPFAVWEVLAVLLILWMLYTFVMCFRRHRGFLNWLSGILLGACAGLFVFVAIWGLGHFGPSVGEYMDMETREYTKQELYDAAKFYAAQANEYALKVKRDADGIASPRSFATLAAAAPEGYAALAKEYDRFALSPIKVKRMTGSTLFSYFGTTGMFICFTAECTVNDETFPLSLPYTMCHEIAHRAGFAAEDDANFCAYLACMRSDDAEFNYSGAYSAFIYCYNALYKVDRDRSAEIWNLACEELKADCRAATAHYQPYEGKVQDAVEVVNDTYLKAFSQEDGVQSYGAVADYLIAYYLQNFAQG